MSTTLALDVPGIHCASCGGKVKTQVLEVTGVEDVDVDVDAKQVVVTGAAIDEKAVRAAIRAAGYEAA